LQLQQPGAHEWWLGTTHSPDAVSCQAETYEIFRALAGRRTAQQVRSWSWSADPEPFIRVGLAVPFRWAEDPISD
jgi:hypothetical protein